MAKKWVYFFGDGKAEGNAKLVNLLGGKGANLHEMTNLDIPVPPGFTITTEACRYFYEKDGEIPPELEPQVREAMSRIESLMGRKFGDPNNPLLVSVRSGAPVSMPGMMDTILNLGLNDESVEGLSKLTNDPRFAYDCYRRLISMYGNVVMGIPHEEFEKLIEQKKREKGVTQDIELTAEDWRDLVGKFKQLIRDHTGKEFPQDPWEQLWGAIKAVFKSWNNRRAIEYRKIHSIPEDLYTAANVQTMVFGNLGEDSATGVAFTRNPATGDRTFYGEYLRNAQGEDVVAGIRTPEPIDKLKEEMPTIYGELMKIRDLLERHYKDIQDIEFTIERGKLYMLQTRRGKRTALANVRIAVDMVKEGLIDKREAIKRVTPEDIEQLMHPVIDPNVKAEPIAKGLPASPGAATGRVVVTSEEAAEWADRGDPVILVRLETSPEDIVGMKKAEGILTQRGGMTSHAAVVARGMGKPCVVGCENINIDYDKKEFVTSTGVTVHEGDVITIDGATGNVYVGDLPKVRLATVPEFQEILQYADEIRRLGVRTNADTPEQAKIAREFGAEGIGLCRTEHMFFAEDRIKAMREMIVAETPEDRKKALAKLLPMQKEDFKQILDVMDGLPVIIRTLDPPLHEFLPKEREQIEEFSKELGIDPDVLRKKVESLTEFNPMLGHRGCRLGITYPEITEMQVRAVFEAACELKKEGKNPIPEIMIPVVADAKEFKHQREVVDRVAKEVMEQYGVEIEYKVGTMIELPRAALTGDEIAKYAEFFSFGTNDLTQTTFGFSRDDVAKFLNLYIEKGILPYDPFQSLDVVGVGELVRIGTERGKKVRPELEVGICGEHGGEPRSIAFCHKVGLDYVSCSPYRVPVARLAAAKAVVEEE
ncbi:pyruvate, phosphate dikinase [candidate division bacterium WOR-3 4484_18]|uniref:Pyruvate, phosphate dikinase n=1 Tax=candidate division WOR-3 bacterium 4484_18 TaxID=2020626 RepID=A0A257LVP8_UNCW3|nr:MAG: pyruvate, phosphate dikinase [candidate division bacterium WOR-3 4484_18]